MDRGDSMGIRTPPYETPVTVQSDAAGSATRQPFVVMARASLAKIVTALCDRAIQQRQQLVHAERRIFQGRLLRPRGRMQALSCSRQDCRSRPTGGALGA